MWPPFAQAILRRPEPPSVDARPEGAEALSGDLTLEYQVVIILVCSDIDN